MSEAKAATQAEPSMEEILASIRRIISEDGTESETSDAEPPRAEPIDDVLELTDVVEEPTAEPEPAPQRSEEHTSELQSLMRISYAVFCLTKNIPTCNKQTTPQKALNYASQTKENKTK